MIKIIPNQVVCKNCLAKLEYESSDVIKTITKYPNIEFEPDDNKLSGLLTGNWVASYVVEKYIECPNCKTKIIL